MHLKTLNFQLITISALFLLMSTTTWAEDAAQKLTNKWSSAYNTLDKQALSALYTDNAHLYVEGSPMIVGRSAIEAFWSNDFSVDSPNTLLTITQSFIGYDVMQINGDYQVVNQDSGKVISSGNFSHIWHEIDGDWKLDQDLWSQISEDQS